MTHKAPNIRDLIRMADGAPRISEASQKTDNPVGVDAVYKWQHNGIPDDHWPLMMRLTGVSLDVIFTANQLLKRRRRRQARRARGNPTPSSRPEHAAA